MLSARPLARGSMVLLWGTGGQGWLLHQSDKLLQLAQVQIRDNPIGHISGRPMDQVVAVTCAPGLLGGYIGRCGPEKQIDDMLLPLVHQGRDRAVPKVIEAPSDQRKTLRRHILDRRGKRQLALKPRFDRVLVGRGHIGEMGSHQGPRVPGDDLLREEVFWRRTGPERLHTPHEEHARGERGADPQPRPCPHAGACVGPAGTAHGGPNALLYMLWRGKRQRARPEGSPQRLLAVVGLRTFRTLVHVLGYHHIADDVQFPIEIRVEQFLCLVTVHGRPPCAWDTSQCCSRWRARARRDMTVPRGTSVMAAISL